MKNKGWKLAVATATLLPTLAFAEPEYASNVPDNIIVPDKIETRFGTLETFDGLPTAETTAIAYDALDLVRGMTAFVDGMPAASIRAFCDGMAKEGIDSQTVGIFEGLYNARSLLLTPNSTTVYVFICTDLADGPQVVDAPKGLLGAVNDAYFRFVTDIGITGPDQGEGGKYLFVPPDYKGDLPSDGYYVINTPSYTNWFFLRAFVGEEGLEATVAEVKDNMKYYPWAERENPPKTKFVNMTDMKLNTIHASNFDFFYEMKAVVDQEIAGALPAELMGTLAAIGIRKGEPFEPGEQLKATLTEAVALGTIAARSLIFAPRDRDGYYYDDRYWKTAFVGGNYEFISEDGQLLDARTLFHYYATGITPAMVAATPGAGSQYALSNRDSEGRYFDGSKTYSVTLPPNVPINNFWSFVVYDTQTRSLLETDQRTAGVDSNSAELKQNEDGSFTVWFSPNAPEGREGNWIQTMPGKSWSTVLRLYGPLEPWFDGSWKPEDVKLFK